MLTSEAKKLLAETIRGTQQDPEKGLRARLLRASTMKRIVATASLLASRRPG